MRHLKLAAFCLVALLTLAGCKSDHHHDDHAGHDMASPMTMPR